MKRRSFLGKIGAGITALSLSSRVRGLRADNNHPNILWITVEDMSPDLGCYGNPLVGTPNIDRLASEGLRYTNAFTVYGVCAPNRNCLITGMYPNSIGGGHMRTFNPVGGGYMCVPPADVRCYSEYLRAAGYFCTNHTKTDYQFDCPITAWDRGRGDWRDPARKPGQPFFSIINLTITHESQIRMPVDKKAVHDPEKITVAPYYPDTPVVLNDYARLYDNISEMDRQVGEILKRLEDDGYADNTIVWFYSDHGHGLPRMKRWCYDDSLHVPLIVRHTGVLRPGSVTDELVSIVDFAPTLLSQAGIEIPKHMQGHAFQGEQRAEPRKYIYGARDRMDEALDMIRAVRDERYKYIKNFMPEKPYAQHIAYMDEMPTMQEWRRLNQQRKLEGPQKLFFAPTKPYEELYDTENDPHEINNLANSPEHVEKLAELRAALAEWMDDIGDLGYIPEEELRLRMWPGGVQPETAKPEVDVREGTGGIIRATMACPTKGASIAYTTESGENAHWNLYYGPVRLEKGAGTLRVRAVRIGWKESEEVNIRI